MSNREMILDLIARLPEDAPLEEFVREIELVAGLKTAREQARRGDDIPAEQARRLAWISTEHSSPK